MNTSLYAVLIPAVVALVVALTAYIQVLTQSKHVMENTKAVAAQSVQLDGLMTQRIQAAVNAGPIEPTQAQRDMPITSNPPTSPYPNG
jgi:hypothetical protein